MTPYGPAISKVTSNVIFSISVCLSDTLTLSTLISLSLTLTALVSILLFLSKSSLNQHRVSAIIACEFLFFSHLFLFSDERLTIALCKLTVHSSPRTITEAWNPELSTRWW